MKWIFTYLRRSILGIFFLALLHFYSRGQSPIIFYDDCESTINTTNWRPVKDYHSSPFTATAEYSAEQARAGSGSFKFFSPPSGKHNMIKLINPLQYFEFDSAYWLGFSVYIPASHVLTATFNLYVQWHGVPDNRGTCDDWRNPVVSINDNKDGVHFVGTAKYQSVGCCLIPTNTCKTYDVSIWQPEIAERADGWNDIVINVKFSLTSGFVHIYINGAATPNFTYTGPLGFNDAIAPDLTLGIYKGQGQIGDMTIYFDEIRVGNSSATYEDVAPRGEPLSSTFQAKPLDDYLRQNYPNPFTGQTTIPYTVNKPSTVNIEIFNMLGQKVKSLTNKNMNAGAYSVVWDGRNDSGKKLPGGTYYYSLKTGGTEQLSRKMIIIK